MSLVHKASAKVPVTIITGFLGSGKTTLITNLLKNLAKSGDARRMALIVNEFGNQGVDGAILQNCGVENCPSDNIIELANGCLCCTVADDFMPAIEKLLIYKPDHILVETSGLALPKPLVKAFDWPEIRSKLTVDGVIAIIDAPAVAQGRFADDPEKLALQKQQDSAIDHDNPLEEVFEDQLACADLIVLNKADLVDEAILAQVRQQLEEKRPGLAKSLIIARQGQADPRALIGLHAAAEDDLGARPSLHDGLEGHHHDDFDSFELDLLPVVDPVSFLPALAEIARRYNILRLKGFLNVPGKPLRWLVQGVGTRLSGHYEGKLQRAEQGRLVLIGLKGLEREAIIAAIKSLPQLAESSRM